MKRCIARLAAVSVLSAAVSAAWAQSPPAEADDVVRFDLSGFTVTGNTLLPQAKIDAVLTPFTGPRRDFGDVQRALEALEKVYHDLGYRMVQIELPEQELTSGKVQFKVVETKIGRVKVRGNDVFDEANIRRSLPPLKEGQTPNLPAVSAAIKLANENPAKKIVMKMQSAEADDEVDAVLDVTDERAWKVSGNFDNTGTEGTGKTHASVVLQHANLFGRDHVASLQYTTTLEKPSQVSVWGAGYHLPLYELGDSIDLFGSYSNVDSGTITAGLINLAVSGKGSVYGARYNQTLIKRGNLEQKLSYGIDYKAFKNFVIFSGQNFGNDITVHPLSVAYNAAYMHENGESNLSLTLAHNIPGGKKGAAEDFNLTRLGAKAAFNVLRFSAATTRALDGDWQVRALLTGQYSPDALIPGEQFGAGGAASVRGFGEREMANDSGVQANLEAYSPNYCAARNGWQCRIVAFMDGAYARRSHALAGELRNSTISSAGLGVRFAVADNINLQLDFGHILHRGAILGTDKNKLHIRLGLSY
ncbi:ShlB/FhaC/HecB family hemolysin secretion/activation protein [Massilia sp. TS11]|uniref:ShlB/FhaC/HecB family hemolysin secretion/activation protein n=1 Tax=Massilia sp. TS11 TaxID=2908003 RepID=UPI001ED9D8CD|nr:ShlB/FhaC/HecB family hemolysin secretion/activation protein [Massilia sp. TS11]MCG2583033.1 BamA/TamA family outer membrane protein [Massilia sp. TS11]